MFPSPLHEDNVVYRFHPVGKLIILVAVILLLLLNSHVVIYLGIFCFLGGTVFLARISPARLFKKVKPLCYFLALMAAVHLFFTPGHSLPPFPLWKVDVTWEGVRNGAIVSIRFFLLILASSLLTMTTPPVELARGLQTVFYPLGLIGLPVSRFSRMVVLTLQFIPVVFSEGESAFKDVAHRTPDFSSLGMFARLPYLVPVVDTIFRRSFQYAEELAEGKEEEEERV